LSTAKCKAVSCACPVAQVGAARNEQDHNVAVVVTRRDQRWRVPVPVPCTDLSTVPKQHLGDLGVAAARRVVQRGRARVVGGARVRTPCQEERRGVTPCAPDRGVERRRAVVRAPTDEGTGF
jgi:hypothetical protein